MDTNRQTLAHLFETRQVDLRRGPLFDASPLPIIGPVHRRQLRTL